MYYGRSADFESDNLTIDIVNDGAVSAGNVYSQPKYTGVLYNAYLIKPNFTANEKILHFFTTSIFKSIKPKFGYENKAGWEKVKKEKIKLPIANGKIDLDYMTGLITELESENIKKLENYLTENELKDYHLNENEKRALENFKKGKVKFKEFKIEDLFNIHNTKSFNKNKLVVGNEYDYVTRTSQNQGVFDKTGFVNRQNINTSGNWSLGLMQMDFFYRKNPWYAGQFVRKISFKEELNEKKAIYFSTLLNKFKEKLLTVLVRDLDKLFLESKLRLPITKNGKINYDSIETLISAIQKLVIKDVVLYVERKNRINVVNN
jgi:hypothetical protein